MKVRHGKCEPLYSHLCVFKRQPQVRHRTSEGCHALSQYGAAVTWVSHISAPASFNTTSLTLHLTAAAAAAAAAVFYCCCQLQNLKDPAAVDRLLSRTPLGRLAHPQDVSGIVAFLAGPGAAFITGQTIAVDGGYSVMGFW